MAKTAVVKARIEPDLKTDAEVILRELGISPTEAVTLFYRQIKMRRGLPFEVRIPNEVTLKTFQDTDAGENIVRTQNKEDLFEKLEI
jgi:DNA-damage-inducible protein J